jgi:two-component system KDP operon response regulator KdpE
MGQASILILGEASQASSPVRTFLVESGFGITGARDVDAAFNLMRSTRFDLLLMDMDAPNRASIRTCQEIRGLSDMGIILLVGKTTEKDRVEALLAGADDCITKPFGMSELLARIRAVRRRSLVLSQLNCSRISLDRVEVDFDRRCVRVGNREERLTPKEFDLLRYLSTRANQTVSHRDLLKAVWGGDYAATDHCLRYYIGCLRKKIEASPSEPKYLLTVPWVGYRLLLPE